MSISVVEGFKYPCGIIPFDAVKDRLLSPCGEYKSVIVAVFPYFAGWEGGSISLYARGRDYHKVIKELMEPVRLACERLGAQAVCMADVSPIPEVYAAALAGLGCIGRNRLLIHPVYGSFVFIGCVLTTAELETKCFEVKYCVDCGRCAEVCPTGALRGEGGCLSAVTQTRRELSEEEREAVRKTGMVWGCDVCQLCCRENSGLPVTDISDFTENLKCSFDADELAGMSDREFRRMFSEKAFSFRGIKPIVRNIGILQDDEG